jgi:preprotein translocase subunit YajC
VRTPAVHQDAGVSAKKAPAVMELLPLLILAGLMYFVGVRPQQKRQRAITSMLASLEVGVDVVTTGGMYGTIVELDDTTVDLQVSSDGLVLRFTKGAVTRIVAAEDETSDDEDSATSEPWEASADNEAASSIIDVPVVDDGTSGSDR